MPDVEEKLGLPKSVVGGWMEGMLIHLKKNPNINLAVASVSNVTELKIFSKNNVQYFVLPSHGKVSKYSNHLYKHWKDVNGSFKPDLVHVHGTEYAHGLAMMDCLPELKYVVSIQGLVSIYARYYFAGISNRNVIRFLTIRDLVYGTLYAKRRDFVKRGEREKQYIRKANHVIGRTGWDKAHTYFFSKEVKYHFCNESLRSGFYKTSKWDISNIDRKSIFLSQAGYPIKGITQVLKAISLLVDEYPSVRLFIGGNKVLKGSGFMNWLKLTSYSKYVKHLIKKFSLEEKVCFLGNLNEKEMIERYKKSNVFICPSSIENSPNSVGEAQVLGVPVVSSYIGGIQDMLIHNKTGLLYRYEEYEMLAFHIKEIFDNDKLAVELSINGIVAGEKRHDSMINCQRTIEIYNEIIN